MAKRSSFSVSGKSISDITNMDYDTFIRLNTSDMRKVVGRLVSAGNKRLRSFEKAGEISPATKWVERSGGKFSTKGKNLNQLRAEFRRARDFLSSETGTRKGWDKVKKEVIEKLKEKGKVEITDEQYDDFWKAYEKLKQLDPNVSSKALKYSSLKEIHDEIEDKTEEPEEVAVKIYNRIDQIYEQAEEEDEEDVDGVSSFFDL